MYKVIMTLCVVGLLFSGCTGIVTGHQYTLEDVEKAEKAYIKVKEEYLKYKGLDVATDSKTTEQR